MMKKLMMLLAVITMVCGLMAVPVHAAETAMGNCGGCKVEKAEGCPEKKESCPKEEKGECPKKDAQDGQKEQGAAE